MIPGRFPFQAGATISGDGVMYGTMNLADTEKFNGHRRRS